MPAPTTLAIPIAVRLNGPIAAESSRLRSILAWATTASRLPRGHFRILSECGPGKATGGDELGTEEDDAGRRRRRRRGLPLPPGGARPPARQARRDCASAASSPTRSASTATTPPPRSASASPTSGPAPTPASGSRVAGRVIAVRRHGGLDFVDLRDETGKIQLIATRDDARRGRPRTTSTSSTSATGSASRGRRSRAARGELSVRIESFELLSQGAARRCPTSATGSPTPRPATGAATST